MDLRNYAVVTAAYWGFTITDGALRMLVLLHFHTLGFSPLQLAFLFLLYEFFGIVTNLLGGWIGSRVGLKVTLFAGLATQIVALTMLSFVQPGWAIALSVAYVMTAQALSGIAKDLTKMSSKSAVKLLVPADTDGDADKDQQRLFKWVAILTGSKNALKGVGFFVGGALLAWVGFDDALRIMAVALIVVLAIVVLLLRQDIGRSKQPRPFSAMFSKSSAINRLSIARFFLFGARDIWFVVALPIYLDEELGWSFEGIGAFLAAWVIGYGVVQSAAPKVLAGSAAQDPGTARRLALALAGVSVAIATLLSADVWSEVAVVGGLIVFGGVFALNSSIHSYLILAYSNDDDVAMDVGFYYSANAAGRLVGTLLSGVVYLVGGLAAALWTSAAFLVATWLLSRLLPAITADETPSSTAA